MNTWAWSVLYLPTQGQFIILCWYQEMVEWEGITKHLDMPVLFIHLCVPSGFDFTYDINILKFSGFFSAIFHPMFDFF